jgi:hypothetical protein
MKEILEKITSYNLFNYLLPGVLFCFIATNICGVSLIQPDLITGAFVYYFIGLVISRFGSLVIEPILKKISFVKFAAYKDFVHVSQKDTKIETLSESNNMYRTFIAMFTLIILCKLFKKWELYWVFLHVHENAIIVVLLLIMFLLSYRKQTN